MGCIAKQFLNKNWILSDYSVPDPCLHMIFAPQGVSTPNGFHKNQKKICVSDNHGRYEVSNFDENSDFCGFKPWFLDNNKHNKVKICFFLYNWTHIFRKWKKTYFNDVIDTYISFQSSNFIQESLFALKGQNLGPNIWGMSWNFGKKIYQAPNVII